LSIPIPGRRQQLGLTQASTPPARQLIFLEGDGRTRIEATGSVTTELPVGPSLLVGPVAGPSVATRQRDHRQAPPEGSRAAHRGGLLRRLALEVLLDVELWRRLPIAPGCARTGAWLWSEKSGLPSAGAA
jgi:hypothetical protein